MAQLHLTSPVASVNWRTCSLWTSVHLPWRWRGCTGLVWVHGAGVGAWGWRGYRELSRVYGAGVGAQGAAGCLGHSRVHGASLAHPSKLLWGTHPALFGSSCCLPGCNKPLPGNAKPPSPHNDCWGCSLKNKKEIHPQGGKKVSPAIACSFDGRTCLFLLSTKVAHLDHSKR